MDMNCNKKPDEIHVDDMFDLGLLLFISAIGMDFQFLSMKSNENENERNNLLKNGHSIINSSKKCCFLHTIIRYS